MASAKLSRDLSTPESANRSYFGMTASVKKREGDVRVQANYTWSRLARERYERV